MIRIAIIILVLLIGCSKSQFPKYYYGNDGTQNFHKDFPNLKLLGHDIHGSGSTYLMPDGRILRTHHRKRGIWKVTVRQPMPRELDYYRKVGIIE